MKKITLALAGIAAVSAIALYGFTDSAPEEAPDFTLESTKGGNVSLDSYKGKYVVLEWFNRGCPFVQKHYESKWMQALQDTWTDKGVVWLTIVSSAPGKQGHDTAAGHNAYAKENKVNATHILMDPTGKVGRAYNAKTTPQMVVIAPSGEIIYEGAIDDKPSPNQATLRTARNFVDEALTLHMAGKPVQVTSHKPYGCAVKYPG